MPSLGTTRRSHRDCLVCGAPTKTAHMGIDVCRACTVFYRRSSEKNETFVCRSGTNQCVAGNELNCRKCRLLHLQRILLQSGAKDRVKQLTKSGHSDNTTFLHEVQPNTSLFAVSNSNEQKLRARPLLSRVRTAYEKMCFARLTGELNSRKNPPSPMQISLRNHPVYPATYTTSNQANRLLLTCIVELGTSSFPEFGQLSDEEKWMIAVKFFFVFRMFEGFIRARKVFSDISDRTFYSYTLWLSEDIAEHFFEDNEEMKGDLEEAKRMIISKCRSTVTQMRSLMERVNPDEEEFLAILVLMFWAPNGLPPSEEITKMSEKYRQEIFKELHHYIRDVRGITDYASRLGMLYMFLPMFEPHEGIKETYEVFRLLGVFPENCFTYSLSKE